MSGFKVNFSVNNQLATPSMHAAALANRPPAGQPGRVFIDTDNPSTGIYRDTGTIWIQIGAGAGALNLQNVTDNGNTTSNTLILTYDSLFNGSNQIEFFDVGTTAVRYGINKVGTGNRLTIQGNSPLSTFDMGLMIDAPNNTLRTYFGSSFNTRGVSCDFTNNIYRVGNVSGTAGQQGIYIDASGQVGIGNTSPTFTLQVTGTFSSSLDATINGVTFGKGGGSISNNVASGQSALLSNTTGSQNVAIGNNAMTLSTGANCNVAIGNNALQSMTGIGFNANIVAIGHNAMNTKTGLIDSNNVVIGSNAMSSGGGTGGQNNVAVGTQAMQNLQSGTRNIAIGFQAGRNNVSGNNNVALGWQSLTQTTGNQNLGLGYGAGLQITTGSNNVVIGGNFASSIATLSNFMLFCDGAGTERFRVPSTGNFLLGSTTDPGQKFYLNGSLRIDGQSSGTAGGSSGQHLIINLDGTQYKIALLNP
jgi:hypothetical protein